MTSLALEQALAQVTPKDVALVARHVAGSPASCEPIFSPPPGDAPEQTTCEHHFFTVSINPDQAAEAKQELFVFAIEVLVYTTANRSTIFVSKADSTGYLNLLNKRSGRHVTSSLIKNILNVFLSHLIHLYQRPGVPVVLSLFARAQGQYLFAGSAENPDKHILDDRALIKWWSRVVDPIMRGIESDNNENVEPRVGASPRVSAYVIVPGCDKFETRGFFPPNANPDSRKHRWANSYPLHEICSHPDAPPRCLVPRFPDDPKARFLLDLDDEIPDNPSSGAKAAGTWRSVKTLEQFWEMMAYRQECSAGRLVGFLWMVVQPQMELEPSSDPSRADTTATNTIQVPPEGLENTSKEIESNINTTQSVSPSNSIILLSNEDYNSLSDCLLELDFANKDIAISSTKLWIERLSSYIGHDGGQLVTGKAEVPAALSASGPEQSATHLNVLDSGMLRKRKRKDSLPAASPSIDPANATKSPTEENPSSPKGKHEAPKGSEPAVVPINTLNSNLIRKKKKGNPQET
ncbi:hypothetical protein FQN57_001980 [Myotisia sp. PD_48]|nr:hypothetical protein FQN57_001980 [Myotisia sp. PD_48]